MSSEPLGLPTPTWVARLTPAIPSAIATIAVQGPAAIESVSALVSFKTVTEFPLSLGQVRYCLWNSADKSEAAEQVVVCRSGVDVVEINCHGGNAVCNMIIRDLVARGCTRVPAKDFPADISCEFQLEAMQDLQRATTDRAAAILLDQFNGSLSTAINRLSNRCRDEGIAAIQNEVQELLRWSKLGLHLTQAWQVVVAGPPNAGKSSLVNAIVGNQRSVVHSEPGTTRDWVDVLTAIDGWPVSLTDTAGLRESMDEIESEGVRRAIQRVEAADLIVIVVDATVGWSNIHDQIQAVAANRLSIIVYNKLDLLSKNAVLRDHSQLSNAIFTSASQQVGISELLKVISTALVPEVPPRFAAVPFRNRHVEALLEMYKRCNSPSPNA